MIHTIAIDPGKRQSAVAVFWGRELVAVGWDRDFDAYPVEGTHLVVEHPQADRRTVGAWIQDLLDMACAGFFFAGRLSAHASAFQLFTPRPFEWKKTNEKPSHHMRALQMLSPAEFTIVDLFFGGGLRGYVATACAKNATRATKRLVGYSHEIHNILDAVALGLTHLGRMSKQSVFAKTRRTFTRRPKI